MFLKQKNNQEIIEVLAISDLIDPYHKELVGRYQHGEELQDPMPFAKSDLMFLSGEPLPQCWVDTHYRDQELQR